MDHFSFCSSLLEILGMLHHDDILNCSLLNRRLLHFIRRNQRLLPRPLRYLSMYTMGVRKGKDVEYLRIQIGDASTENLSASSPSSIFYLTKTTIHVVKAPNSALLQMIQDTFIPSETPLSKEEIFDLDIAGLCDLALIYKEFDSSLNLRFRCESVQEGMVRLLRFAFERYYFEKIDINIDIFGEYTWSLPDDWYDVIREVFARSGSKCKRLHLGKGGKAASRLYENIDCPIVQIVSLGCPLSEFISNGRCWSQQLSVHLALPSFDDSFQPILQIFQKWKDGTGHISGLAFVDAWRTTVFTMSNQAMVDTLSSILGRPLRVNYLDDTLRQMEMCFGRAGDHYVLCVSYDRTDEFHMYDVPFSDLDSLEPFEYHRFTNRERLHFYRKPN